MHKPNYNFLSGSAHFPLWLYYIAKGFALTLAALAVVCLIGVPTFLVTVVGGHSNRREAIEQQNLDQIGSGLQQYTMDYSETLPPIVDSTKFKEAIYPYVRDDYVFHDTFKGDIVSTNAALSCRKIASISNVNYVVAAYGRWSASECMALYIRRSGERLDYKVRKISWDTAQDEIRKSRRVRSKST